MKRSFVGVAVLALAVSAGGCNDAADLSDAELFIGNWTASRVVVDGTDITALLEGQIRAITASFTAAGSFTLTVDYIDPEEEDVSLSGTYLVNERDETLALSVIGEGGTTEFPMTYRFETEDRVVLSFNTDGSLIEGMTGSVRLTITRV